VSRHVVCSQTTRRAATRHGAERPDAFDVLLSNREGELTELTIGNLVAEIDGELLTPAQDAGLLAGTMRAELLARGEIREKPLRVAHLREVRRLWLVNARVDGCPFGSFCREAGELSHVWWLGGR
jgi:para-aminobenzoate synthetase/4-amino-4-deoxychorismate lyase